MRKILFTLSFVILLGGILSALVIPAMADDDPPGRVARLNYIQGSVSFKPGGEDDWVQANPNRPLTVGDNLWADQRSERQLPRGHGTSFYFFSGCAVDGLALAGAGPFPVSGFFTTTIFSR